MCFSLCIFRYRSRAAGGPRKPYGRRGCVPPRPQPVLSSHAMSDLIVESLQFYSFLPSIKPYAHIRKNSPPRAHPERTALRSPSRAPPAHARSGHTKPLCTQPMRIRDARRGRRSTAARRRVVPLIVLVLFARETSLREWPTARIVAFDWIAHPAPHRLPPLDPRDFAPPI